MGSASVWGGMHPGGSAVVGRHPTGMYSLISCRGDTNS